MGQAVLTESESEFEHFWRMHGEWVEPPNLRRGGESGVQRVQSDDGRLWYIKRQTGHIYRSWLYPFGRPTVLRERDALKGLHHLGVAAPTTVFCGAERNEQQQWRALLVTEALEGYEPLDDWYAAGGRECYGEALHEQMLKTLADNLARMHRGRWQHSCLYIKHVFVKVSGEGEQARAHVALLDLEKARKRLTARRAALHDIKQLRRHSSFNTPDWEKFIYFYQTAFGSALKGLE